MDTFRVSVGGKVVGPVFDLWQEDAHVWVAKHHPGRPYMIITVSVDKPDFVVKYPAR